MTTIKACRGALAAGNRKEYDRLKRSLPGFCFMADHFEPNRGSKGTLPEGTWRLQSAAVLNGLVMLDVDHVEDPRGLFERMPQHLFDDATSRTAVMLVHVTPSGEGLRVVFQADEERGDIAANQQYMATVLGVQRDESCCNADRLSFAVDKESILFINEKIFDYDNKEFDEKFGGLYRGVSNQGHRTTGTVLRTTGTVLLCNGALHSENRPQDALPQDALPQDAPAQEAANPAQEDSQEDAPTYAGREVRDIALAYLERYGAPAVGGRHKYLLQLAARLRPLVENSAAALKRVAYGLPFVQDMVREGGTAEVERAIADATTQRGGYSIGPAMQAVLEGLGIKADSALKRADDDSNRQLADANREFWRRLEGHVGEPYATAVTEIADENRLGAIFASGTMFCTLMTRCTYEHYDGRRHRMNPQTYIIGKPASGKSFADELNKAVMAAMKAADAAGRDAERRYKEAQKERATSTKAQKGEPLKKPDVMIRYLPTNTSNSTFFTRLEQAREVVGGEVLPLHLYMFDTELEASVKAQGGGAWIGKHDMELKAFHNEETGVDFKNMDSANGTMDVYWNTVTTGTKVALAKKITLRNVNDGYCSRLAIFPMVSSRGEMIAKGSAANVTRRDTALKEWGYFFDAQKGELNISRLIDHVYSLCQHSADVVRETGDDVLDYLRKRAVFYATWFTVPQIVARIRGKYHTRGKERVPYTLDDIEVTDDDLILASVIYDAVIFYQDHFFGQMLQDSWENGAKEFVPRTRHTRTDEDYGRLPEEFTVNDIEQCCSIEHDAAHKRAQRWCHAGYTQRVKKGTYRKVVKTINY